MAIDTLRFKDPRHHPTIRWPYGAPTTAISAPQEPAVLAILEAHKLLCKVIEGGYDLINSNGDAIELPFSAPLADWAAAAAQLSALDAPHG